MATPFVEGRHVGGAELLSDAVTQFANLELAELLAAGLIGPEM
jgi:hypothetical protein